MSSSTPNSALDERANRSSAARSSSGSVLRLRSARRRIPAAALGESENLAGIGPVSSKSRKEEEAKSSLGDAETARVQHAPRHIRPEVIHGDEDPAEVSSSMNAKDLWYVFQEEPSRTALGSEPKPGGEEPAPVVVESATGSRNGEALAGRAAAPEVCFRDLIWRDLRDVFREPVTGAEAVLVHAACALIDLARAHALVARALEPKPEAANASEPVDEAHAPRSLAHASRAVKTTFC